MCKFFWCEIIIYIKIREEVESSDLLKYPNNLVGGSLPYSADVYEVSRFDGIILPIVFSDTHITCILLSKLWPIFLSNTHRPMRFTNKLIAMKYGLLLLGYII